MISHKAYWTGVPLALLAAGCIIVPGDPALIGPNSGSYGGSYNRSGTPIGSEPTAGSRTDWTKPAPTPKATLREATVPIIAALSANPTTLTQPGQEVVFHIEAVDASGTPAYTWTATGGTLSSTVGTRVGWRSPDKPGRYTVLVVVTSPSGGATTGAVNIEVSKDGRGQVVPEPPASPAPIATSSTAPDRVGSAFVPTPTLPTALS